MFHPIHRFAVVAAIVCSLSPLAHAGAGRELGVTSLIYVGTQTGEKSKGIYLFQMKTSDNPDIPEFVTMTSQGLVAETSNPTFLEFDPVRRLLFCVNELNEFNGQPSGAVSAFAIDPSGKLTLLNQQPSMGAGPRHLALDRQRKHLLIANAVGGTVSVLPVDAEGRLGAATDVRQHSGKSAHPVRQKGPHPQGVAFSPDNRFALVCDVGLDKVMIYRFDTDAGRLAPHDPPFVDAKPGAGPRRLVFRPDGKFAYVLNELDSTVTAYSWDAGAGVLKELQTESTLPGYYDGPNTTAEIGVHPSGKYLLVSNCGHHSVVLFGIDAAEGTLTYIEDQSTYGTMPVHFGIDAAGKHVIVANQESGSLLILRAPENARVKPGANVIEAPSPTCALFLPPDSK